MKKSIKAELVSLAHKILQLRDTTDYSDLAIKARDLHEKLTVLAYAEKLENTAKPTIGLIEIEEQLADIELLSDDEVATLSRNSDSKKPIPETPIAEPAKTPAQILAENQARFAEARSTDTGEDDRHRPDGTQFNKEEPVHEPVIEKIKDMWPEMAPEAAGIDKVIESIIPAEPAVGKNDSFEIGNEYQMPIFERKDLAVDEIDNKPKNLNDKLKGSTFKVGLNDKLSFIKHLFNGSAADYNRVLSQLETFQSSTEAKDFIFQMIKPDYGNWEGKDMQEERFMEVVEGRYS